MSTLHPAPVAATEEKAGAGRHSTCGCATDLLENLEACHVRVRAAGAAGGPLAAARRCGGAAACDAMAGTGLSDRPAPARQPLAATAACWLNPCLPTVATCSDSTVFEYTAVRLYSTKY